jgi:hypothetical protein
MTITRAPYPTTRLGVAAWHVEQAQAPIARAAGWRAAAEANRVRAERFHACAEQALDIARFHKALAMIILSGPDGDVTEDALAADAAA